MHLTAQRLQLLLVGDTEMLLLVHHQQPEVLELDAAAEQRMSANDDIDAALGHAGFRRRKLRMRHQARGLCHVDRETAKAVRKGLEVLARQQRGRHDDRALLAADGGDEGRTQRHFSLAEADVAADEAIHRPPRAEILDGGVDRRELVVGFLVRKAGAELVIGARPDRQARRLA